jgi:membrane-bound lytic murein transglycosylase B
MNKVLLGFSLSLILATQVSCAWADGVSLRPETRQFIDRMVSKHHFNRNELIALLGQAQTRQDIITAMTKPAEAKPWFQYRPIFINDARIQGGVEFWNKHEALLTRAQATYGVPPEIITAIIGVETRYGKNTGTFRVLDALYTLGFDYPPRSPFFLGELEEYLLLTREEKMDPALLKGSYAGAMGQPQFISSSYRKYAVDFDDDGARDLWQSLPDIIGSVANYFKAFGWQSGQPVMARAQVRGEEFKNFLGGVAPNATLASLKEKSVTAAENIAPDQQAVLLEYQGESNPEYWLGLQNFYVITSYNRSPLYAMAVYQLAQEIRTLRDTPRVKEK